MLTYDTLSSSLTTLVQRIEEKCKRNWTVEFQHDFREVNKVINCIAKSCCKNKYDRKIIDSPMSNVRKLILEDKMVGLQCNKIFPFLRDRIIELLLLIIFLFFFSFHLSFESVIGLSTGSE